MRRPLSYWACRGQVRGDCGHAHKSLRAALACLKRDAAGCRRQGGYSDRRVVHVEGPCAWPVAAIAPPEV